MKKQIQEIINQHLPAQVAGEMKTFIESLEQVRADLSKSEEEVGKLLVTVADYRKKDAKYAGNTEEEKRLNAVEQHLDSRQGEIQKREDRIEIELIKERNTLMEANMKNMESLVQKVFGHPAVTITRQVPVSDGYNNSNGSYSSGESLMHATEKTVESKE